MRRPNLNVLKHKTAATLIAVVVLLFSVTTKTSATVAPSTFSTGHITYSSGPTLVGNYSTVLSNAASYWNNAISANGCTANISLTNVAPGDVIVSFTSTYADHDVLGRVSLQATDIYGHGYIVNLTDATNWEYGFLYVYPEHIMDAIDDSLTYDEDDFPYCIRKTTVHEFGHILGLMHPESQPVSSVMTQGLSTSFLPTDYDKQDLHNQWCT